MSWCDVSWYVCVYYMLMVVPGHASRTDAFCCVPALVAETVLSAMLLFHFLCLLTTSMLHQQCWLLGVLDGFVMCVVSSICSAGLCWVLFFARFCYQVFVQATCRHLQCVTQASKQKMLSAVLSRLFCQSAQLLVSVCSSYMSPTHESPHWPCRIV